MNINPIEISVSILLYLSFIPLIVNFVILLKNAESAQKIARALVWQLAALAVLPLIAGFVFKYASGWTREHDALLVGAVEVSAALFLSVFCVGSILRKSKAEAWAFGIAAFSVLFWAWGLYSLLCK